jgi:hypothetical protein
VTDKREGGLDESYILIHEKGRKLDEIYCYDPKKES